MTLTNQIWFIIMAVCLLLFVLLLLKKGVLTVKYSLLWLFCGAGLLLAALFPYIIYVIRDILDMVMPSNVVFLIMFAFVLLLLLSHSIAVSQLSEKSKRQTQSIALLEKRVRDLEAQMNSPKE
jgi:hypothetical protein